MTAFPLPQSDDAVGHDPIALVCDLLCLDQSIEQGIHAVSEHPSSTLVYLPDYQREMGSTHMHGVWNSASPESRGGVTRSPAVLGEPIPGVGTLFSVWRYVVYLERQGTLELENQTSWRISHIRDLRYDLDWIVIPTANGRGWRLDPSYTPELLRHHERTLIHYLRGGHPQLSNDPEVVARCFTPVQLTGWAAAIQGQSAPRSRLAVAFYPSSTHTNRLQLTLAGSAPPPAAPMTYVVKLHWHRLHLRPYRSLGYWLIDSVARVAT